MSIYRLSIRVVLWLSFSCWMNHYVAAQGPAPAGPLFQMDSVRDAGSLDPVVIHDWQPAPREPSVQQKLISITVCEWWQGQKVRLPVTLNAPTKAIDTQGNQCQHVLIANQSLANKTGRLSAAQLDLIKSDGVGVVLIGMGTIDIMEPVGKLHHAMRQQFLNTQHMRFTPGWIWGISQMRALTAAMAEENVFRPTKVMATGGSKRGVATAIAGIYDDRFTAILPVVAPPLGNPGGTYVLGTEPKSVTESNAKFFADLDEGKLGLPSTAKAALEARSNRRSAIRVTLEQAREANWTPAEIDSITDRVWNVSRITNHLPRLQKRGLEIFYNVGTNDSVSPALLELGERFPEFPICIIPGGQHGGPSDAGFTRRVTKLPEIQDNFTTFARAHFRDARKLVGTPQIRSQWNAEESSLNVTVSFPDGTRPQKNTLWWNQNRSEPYTLPFEYDAWFDGPLAMNESGNFEIQLRFDKVPDRIDFLSLHTHTENELPLTLSSPYQRITTRKAEQ